MSEEYLKSIIDIVSGIEVKSETEQIAKYELIEWVEYLENNTLELLEEVKLKQTQKVFEALEQVIKTGSCSYRHLIYDMLGFSPEHYQDLISGLTITNAIVELEELKELLKTMTRYALENETKIDELRNNWNELKEENKKLRDRINKAMEF